MTNKLVVIINSLKVPKIKKILLHEMKFLVPSYSYLRNSWLEVYRPHIPILSDLCPQLNLLNPHQIKFLGTTLNTKLCRLIMPAAGIKPWFVKLLASSLVDTRTAEVTRQRICADQTDADKDGVPERLLHPPCQRVCIQGHHLTVRRNGVCINTALVKILKAAKWLHSHTHQQVFRTWAGRNINKFTGKGQDVAGHKQWR